MIFKFFNLLAIDKSLNGLSRYNGLASVSSELILSQPDACKYK